MSFSGVAAFCHDPLEAVFGSPVRACDIASISAVLTISPFQSQALLCLLRSGLSMVLWQRLSHFDGVFLRQQAII